MAGIKIINILKDDSFPDILELFRQTPAAEVIFVLPKNGKVFRSEDHFAAFASEAAGSNKTISILCNTPQAASWARKYQFNVMSSGKSTAPSKTKKAAAILAVQPPPQDPDIQDYNEDAFQSDVPMTSDETMNIKGQDEGSEESDPLHGMHIVEDEDEAKTTKGDSEEPTDEDLTTTEENEASFVSAPAGSARADLDYIDTVWRQKASQTNPAPTAAPLRRRRLSVKVPKTIAASLLVASVGILGAIVYMTTGSAAIAITPVSHPVDTQITVQASDIFSAVDPNFGKIPGQLFQVSKTAVQQGDATGQRDVASKARGTITISNAFSTAPQTLIATTRLQSPDGLIFHTLQTITVPGMTAKGTPGTVNVQVIADKPGAQYDIQATTFTLPAFKERNDAERYAKFTGQSSVAFSGGANGPSKVVTQTDYDTAKTAALASVAQQIKDAFAQEDNGMMIIGDTSPQISVVGSNAHPDDAADNLTITASGSLTTVAFRKSDLSNLIAQTLLQKERLEVLPDTLILDYSDIVFKSDTGVLSFTVSVKGTGYTPIDQQAVLHDVKGMDGTRIHDYFAARDGVAAATISLSPFWVRSVPTADTRIHLTIVHDAH